MKSMTFILRAIVEDLRRPNLNTEGGEVFLPTRAATYHNGCFVIWMSSLTLAGGVLFLILEGAL